MAQDNRETVKGVELSHYLSPRALKQRKTFFILALIVISLLSPELKLLTTIIAEVFSFNPETIKQHIMDSTPLEILLFFAVFLYYFITFNWIFFRDMSGIEFDSVEINHKFTYRGEARFRFKSEIDKLETIAHVVINEAESTLHFNSFWDTLIGFIRLPCYRDDSSHIIESGLNIETYFPEDFKQMSEKNKQLKVATAQKNRGKGGYAIPTVKYETAIFPPGIGLRTLVRTQTIFSLFHHPLRNPSYWLELFIPWIMFAYSTYVIFRLY